MRFLLIIFLATVTGSAVADDDLPRRGQIGVLPQPAPDGRAGALIAQVVPDSTAAALGLEPGDLLVEVDGAAIGSPPDLFAASGRLRAGAEMTIAFEREGTRSEASAVVRARPFEEPMVGQIRYDSLPYAGGRLRTIINTPDGDGPFPTVLYIQGYTCGTIESPNPASPHRRIAREFVGEGFAFVRVEKVGVGDSIGPQRCEDIDFATELAGFSAAWDYTVALPESQDDQLFLIGISMGGIQAPLVAAESSQQPAGTIVWGTRLDSWHDYMYDLIAVQPVLLGTVDPVTARSNADAARPVLRRFFLDQVSAADILAEDPGAAASLQLLGRGADGRFFGRSERYFQEIATAPLREAWRDMGGAVLSLYGATDITAIDGAEQALIASLVNHYRPGTAAYQVIPDTNHGMAEVGDRETYRGHWAAGTAQSLASNFNPAVSRQMVEFALAVLAGEFEA